MLKQNSIIKFLASMLFFIATISTPIFASKINVHKILLVVAMDTEAKPIINGLHLRPLQNSFSDLPMRGYIGKQRKIDIMLIMNGTDPVNKVQNIGTEAATLSTYLGINYFHPDLVISIGTAGGIKENGSRLREVYFSKKIYFSDRRIPMPGYYKYGLGGYDSASFPAIEKKLKFKIGAICTEGSFDEEVVDYKMFLKERCSAVDMEAAGVAWVSMLMKTPMIAIKGVTNFVKGEHIHSEFEKNVPMVMTELVHRVKEFINTLG